MAPTQLAEQSPSIAQPAHRAAAPKSALLALSLAMLLASLGTSIANVGLPTLAEVFAASFQEVQWVLLSYLLAITTLIVGVGRAGDVIGRRRLLLLGLVVFTLASALCGLAPKLWVLVAARGVQGIGAAIMMALTLAFVGDTVPKAKIGRAMGLLGTMSAIGTALGPSIGGALIAAFGWRAMFVVNVPLGVVAFLLAYRQLPSETRRTVCDRPRFDYWGMFVLALSLGAYALAMTTGRGEFSALNFALLFAAALGVAVFVFVEKRTASPLLSPAMFRDPVLRTSVTLSAIVSTVMMATLVVGPFYLARTLGLDAASVGIVLSVGPLVAALMSVPAGRMTDRFGAEHITVAGLVALAAGASGLVMLPASLGIVGYLAPVVLMTAGYGLFQTANNTAVMRDLQPDRRGVVSGLLNLSRNVGLITGASAMGAVFSFAAGSKEIAAASPTAVAAGMRAAFCVAALLIAAAIALSRRNRRPL